MFTLPRTTSIIRLGEAKISHDRENGFILEGNYNNAKYKIIRKPLAANSVQVEYDHVHIKPFDCFVINTEDNTYFCYPKKNNVLTKISFATEAIYSFNLRKAKDNKKSIFND